MSTIRVAALQFATAATVEENLHTCLRLIDRAAEAEAALMVLPEFSNHLSWYRDAHHAWAVAVEEGGEFLSAIAGRAARYRAHIVVNVSLRRARGGITVSSLLYGPEGTCLAVADKQTLMGHENIWFQRAQQRTPVVPTALGRLGLFPCRDGVTFETARMLALEGAQIFCDSLHSFALDEATLHVPARAPENRVFMVAANKVGPLIPEQDLPGVAAQSGIPERFLYGAGGSQIVAPDGTVLARAPGEGEAVVTADIDPSAAADKRRADGTDLLASRRPGLYRALGAAQPRLVASDAPEALSVACVAPPAPGAAAREHLTPGTRLAVIPECWGMPEDIMAALNSGTPYDREAVIAASSELVERLRHFCQEKGELKIVASLPWPLGEGLSLTALLISAQGVEARQPQLHPSHGSPWSRQGDELQLADLEWGRVALLVGNDSLYPELVKMAALDGAHLLAVPLGATEPADTQLGLPSRAAENRLCVVASGREGHGGLIAGLEAEFTLMEHWPTRVFDGNINTPLLTRQRGEVTQGCLNLRAAANKVMSAQTDLLADRPWRLCAPLWEDRGQEEICDEL
ncbi:nitrilase-related carbon-nitrogen hydrolase [Haliea sp. E17]|uniref:nitrilase-related carbon-nitrogen hydrolase n=1 Tax=Haliea sp. E17 TaxID=3401576 RepID=UPI003AACAC38